MTFAGPDLLVGSGLSGYNTGIEGDHVKKLLVVVGVWFLTSGVALVLAARAVASQGPVG